MRRRTHSRITTLYGPLTVPTVAAQYSELRCRIEFHMNGASPTWYIAVDALSGNASPTQLSGTSGIVVKAFDEELHGDLPYQAWYVQIPAADIITVIETFCEQPLTGD